MRPKIIACDFDETLFTGNYPNVGEPIFMTINMLKLEQQEGAKIILWTNRSDEPLTKAVQACNEEGLFFDAVNDNLPERYLPMSIGMIEWFRWRILNILE